MSHLERAAANRILSFGREQYRTQAGYANIASPLGVAQYVAIAAEVAAWIDAGKILDWGAGWGQNSLLLSAHGARTTAYDIEDKGAAEGLLCGTGIPYRLGEPGELPFADGEFDGVLNCGVLEHVRDEREALAELRRVLRPGGHLFTYHLPNRYAWTERLGRTLGRAHHDRTYTRATARGLFESAGFRILRHRPFHLLPRNLWAGLPGWCSQDERVAAVLSRLDAGLARVPGLALLCTAWALVAERP